MARHTIKQSWLGPAHEELECDSIVEGLKSARVVSFKITDDGDGVRVTEECDEYFEAHLTRDQLFELGSELQRMAYGDDIVEAFVVGEGRGV